MSNNRRSVTIYASQGGRLDGKEGLVYPVAGYVERRATRRIVDDFANVTDADSALYFVSRYGSVLPMHAQRVSGEWASESVRTVLNIARRIDSMRKAHIHLAWDSVPPLSACEPLFGFGNPPKGKKRLLELARTATLNTLQGLIEFCRLRPAFSWNQTQRRYDVGWTDLPNAPVMLPVFSCALSAVVAFIAEDLTESASTTRLEETCDICGRIYETERHSTPKRGHYCPDCRGTPAMWRRLKQLQRAKASTAADTRQSVSTLGDSLT